MTNIIDDAIAKYVSNPAGEILNLMATPNVRLNAKACGLIGTHYMSIESDEKVAADYLISTIELGGQFPMFTYNLGYLYETQARRTGKKSIEQSMILCYTNSMKNSVWQAFNQLGCYFIEDPNISFEGYNVEQLLLKAAEHKLIPGFVNLIKLYKNDYEKRINIMKRKYDTSGKMEDLMSYMLEMLNNKDYKGYCKWRKSEGDNTMSIEAFLKNSPSVVSSECCVCLEEKSCFKLSCTHVTCNNCLFEVYCNSKPLCPICRADL